MPTERESEQESERDRVREEGREGEGGGARESGGEKDCVYQRERYVWPAPLVVPLRPGEHAGGVSGWSDPPNASKSLHSRQKCVRPCYQGNVNRMLVDQPADFVQKYANAPHHRAVPCPPSLFPGTQVGGSGIAAAQGGDAAQAIDHYLTALSIARETRDRAVEGEVCHSLGMIYRNVGDYPKAIAYHDMRLAIANEIGDSAGQGNAYFSLGLCFFSLERYRKAVTVRLAAPCVSAHGLCALTWMPVLMYKVVCACPDVRTYVHMGTSTLKVDVV